jgi:single-stranded-DNA-specific exonuclease
MAARGLDTDEAIDHFLNPRLSDLGDPFRLPALEKAVQRIWTAVDGRERIVVFGDYDVDGITSTALLVQVLRVLGADAQPFLPHRMEEGYGLSPEAFTRCREELKPGLIVTVDCGTGSVAAVRAATAAGIDVVVTDHHTPGDQLAPALALVNPKLGPHEELQVLAGVGVAFKLCHALVKHGRAAGRAAAELDLRRYLDLVALGTITDIVPLTGENRILARHGLAQMNRTECAGLAALARVAGINARIDAYEVGFRIGPRLNAAGRLGDALLSLELLLGSDPQRIEELAHHLDATNRERQEIEARILQQATDEIDDRFDGARDFGVVVARAGFHPGVVGIVASRLAQRYNRPAVVIGIDDEGGRGSCRSIEGFDMVAGLQQCAPLLRKFGGHAMAAGLEIGREQVAAFSERFNEVAAAALSGADLRPVQKVDAWMELGEADERMMEALEQMRPFGFGNSTPVWAAGGLRLVGPPRVVGQGHLKLMLASGGVQREAIGWGLGARPIPDGPLDVAFQLRRESYQGRERLVLNVQDFRPSAAPRTA